MSTEIAKRITAAARIERKRLREDTERRIQAAQEETRRIVVTGTCPLCHAGLRRNLALTGWWQCEQKGAVGFRKDATTPSCSWQGFTE